MKAALAALACLSALAGATACTGDVGSGAQLKAGEPPGAGTSTSSSGAGASGSGGATSGSSTGGASSGGSGAGGSSTGGSSSGGSGNGGSSTSGSSSGGAGSGGSGGMPSSSSAGGSSGAGGGTMLGNCAVFPADNPWNTDVSNYPLHPNSDAFIDSIGRFETMHPDFGTEWLNEPIGIPYVVVPGSQEMVPINFVAYPNQSDPGPYPVPPNAPIEGGANANGDRHVLVVDGDNCVLYEMYNAWPQNGGASWDADSGAVWDLKINDTHPLTWTSADAAGLPIFAGLVRYDEVVQNGEITHALRFTVSQSQEAYVLPAVHYASNAPNPQDPDLPPMGLRLRMKGGYDCSGKSSEAQVVCAALKKYGMIVADNGSDWYLSGAHDPSWDDSALGDLKDIPGDAFEVVDTGPIQTY